MLSSDGRAKGESSIREIYRLPPSGFSPVEVDLKAEERGDGSADYALYYTDSAWAARRVMLYLGAAVVVEPEELRQEVHQQAGSLLRMYEGG